MKRSPDRFHDLLGLALASPERAQGDHSTVLSVPVKTTREALNPFSLFNIPEPQADRKPTPKPDVSQRRSATAGPQPYYLDHSRRLITEDTESTRDFFARVEANRYPEGYQPLYLPIIMTELKKVTTSRDAAANQARMYLTAGARFLQECGMLDVPVYALLTDGYECTLEFGFVRKVSNIAIFLLTNVLILVPCQIEPEARLVTRSLTKVRYVPAICTIC